MRQVLNTGPSLDPCRLEAVRVGRELMNCGGVRLTAVVLLALAACGGAETGEPAPPEQLEAETYAMSEQTSEFALLDFMVRCLAEFGFEVERVGPGIRVPDPVVAAQAGALEHAFESCNEQAIGAGVVEPLDMSDPQTLKRVYRDLVDLNECLADHGIQVPKPPTLESYVDSGGSWNPFSSLNRGNWKAGDEACPSEYFSYVDLNDYGIRGDGS